MNQKFYYQYKDHTLEVTVDAQNGEDEWANNTYLMDALHKVIMCAGNWKHFDFTVKAREYEE